MKTESIQLSHDNLILELLKEKVVWLPEQKIILLADLHFGKASHFRKAGIPIPEQIHHQDLINLEYLIEKYSPKQFFFLGDIFHSDFNDQWHVLNDFLQNFGNIEFHLVLGNHDILSDEIYKNSCFVIHEGPIALSNLILSHEPMEKIAKGHLNICGHIHPGIRLNGRAKKSIKLPCFYLEPGQLVLPAFGHFTGLAVVSPSEEAEIYGIGPESLIKL